MDTDAPDHLRGLALTCAVLMLLGVVALVRNNPPARTTPTRRAALVAAGEADGSTARASVPPTLLPLFPTTTSTRPGRPTTTAKSASARTTVVDARMTPPPLGVYTFAVDGKEEATGFGARDLPATMTLTAHRRGAAAGDEVIFDLRFSSQHSEREIVRYRPDMVTVRQQTMTVAFGPTTRNSAASYGPPVGRAALPLAAGSSRAGASEARDDAGQLLRTEEWKVVDVAPRGVTVAGAAVTAWEITVDRWSRPGAAEQLRETTRAWFDPARRMWVKWEMHRHTERSNVTSAYDLDYTATLTSFAPA